MSDDRLHDAARAVNELWADSDATMYRLTRLRARLAAEEGATGPSLLLVNDDDLAAAAVSVLLARHGFDVTHARSGEEALRMLVAQGDRFRVVLLDLGPAERNGYEVCGRIREHTSAVVILAGERSDMGSRIHGLSLGADEYVVKPYDTGELLARIHAVSRRTAHASAPGAGETVLRLGPVEIELPTRRVSVDGSAVQLTRKEFDLLALLAQRPGVVVRREQIISEVWRTSWEETGRVLETYVASLRAKLGVPALIETVRGVGYRLNAPGA